MERYFVNTALLNVRSAPMVNVGNIIGRIHKFMLVGVVEKTKSDWWQVQFMQGDLSIKGFVASRFLTFFSEPPMLISTVTAVNFPPDPRAHTNSKIALHKPMGDSTIPVRDMRSAEAKTRTISALIDKLDVSRSFRYQRTESNTFCNIYAFDFCHFCSAYLPRVWWDDKSINLLTQGRQVEVKYAETVREQNANALHDWLLRWGGDFGWKRADDADILQNLVNVNGGVGVISAKRKDTRKSGHITVVVPETSRHRATRANGTVLYPLQSQAGAQNFNYFSAEKERWWTHGNFGSFVFFYHD